jgi:hypothetical protein
MVVVLVFSGIGDRPQRRYRKRVRFRRRPQAGRERLECALRREATICSLTAATATEAKRGS